jgi:hypothetical protein
MLASTGEAGPIALSEGGGSFCIRHGALPPPPPVEDPPAAPSREDPAPVAAAPTDTAPAAAPDNVAVPPDAAAAAPENADEPPVAAAVSENVVVPPAAAAVSESVAVPPVAPAAASAGPGTVSGTIAGPSVTMVAAIVLLGPDNILHEAARATPDDQGRFAFHALPPGSYRIVAAGKGGRVVICEPPFITIRVSSNGAVEAPVLNVIRAL